MNTLAPKLVLTPLLVASTSVAGRSWRPALSGWLVALPLTSGPIALFIALEAGTDVARQAAGGSLLGASAQVAFAAGYVLASRRLPWPLSLVVAALAFFAVAFAVPAMPPLLTFGLLLASVGTFLATVGRRRTGGRSQLSPPTWDIPARVVVATALVLAISSLAPVLGGRFSGILATFPVYAAVLATFAHVTRGPGEAADVLRGLATGLLGFGAFLPRPWRFARRNGDRHQLRGSVGGRLRGAGGDPAARSPGHASRRPGGDRRARVAPHAGARRLWPNRPLGTVGVRRHAFRMTALVRSRSIPVPGTG